MEEKSLEYRMYFFVPYNISPIQQAIQAGHCVEEYADLYHDDAVYKEYRKDKTWIILNGGTTNNRFELGTGIPIGTLNQILEDLQHNAIPYAYFQEPDLNDALTAVCFIADERVWNRADYPDFTDYLINSYTDNNPKRDVEIRVTSIESLIFQYTDKYMEWVDFVGGKKNVFLRELIKGKKKA